MLASALVAGIVVGGALGGDVRRLGELRIRWLPLVVVGIALHLAALLPIAADAQHYFYVVSLWSLALASVRNFAQAGAGLMGAGIALNALVVTSSFGVMPVSAEALALSHTAPPADPLHVVAQESPVLADVIPLPLGVYSPGDVLLACGAFLLVVSVMRGAK
jgi:hypothetical protein